MKRGTTRRQLDLFAPCEQGSDELPAEPAPVETDLPTTELYDEIMSFLTEMTARTEREIQALRAMTAKLRGCSVEELDALEAEEAAARQTKKKQEKEERRRRGW